MTRRSFVTALGGASALTAQSPTPAVPLKLGIDTYSLRAFKWNVDQMLDYAELHKLDAIQASRGDFTSFEEPYLTKVKDRAQRLGVIVEPGWGCISTVSKQWNPKQGTPASRKAFERRDCWVPGRSGCSWAVRAIAPGAPTFRRCWSLPWRR